MGYSIPCPLIFHRIGARPSRNLVFSGGTAKPSVISRVLKFQLKPFCCKLDSIKLEERKSPAEVKKEIEKCYELIQRLGRGVVYLGSARLGPGHPHYAQAFELGKEIATLLNCTSWSGAGPGLMDAVTRGAMKAGKPVGGFKISKEAGEWTATKVHPYLPLENYLTCRFFSARKHGLVDATVRATSFDRTAVVVLPGGIGTLDEAFEILALIQLQRIGSFLPVPFLLMNYDLFYSKLLEFINECEIRGLSRMVKLLPYGKCAILIQKHWLI